MTLAEIAEVAGWACIGAFTCVFGVLCLWPIVRMMGDK